MNINDYTPTYNQGRPQYDHSNTIDALYQLSATFIPILANGVNDPTESGVALAGNQSIEFNKNTAGIVLISTDAVAGTGIRVRVATFSGASAGFLVSPQILNAATGVLQVGLITAPGLYVIEIPYKYITITSEDGATAQNFRISLGNK